MPLTRAQVEELEAQIDDEQLSKVRFGRSRFLRDAGLALFGLTAGMFAMSAGADEADAAPPGCSGAPTCRSCRGATCRRCARRAHTCGGRHCWRIRRGCRVYRCCDWVTRRGSLCICRGFVGYAC
jgi:hypothetical protein